MVKPLEPLARRLMKGVLLLELGGVLGALGLYRSMDSSADFRSTMSRKFPSVLEAYYVSNEWAGIYGLRERDRQAWAAPRQD